MSETLTTTPRPESYLASLASKKRTWTPSGVGNEPVVKGAEVTLAKCLALRLLEIPVGEFVNQASTRELKIDQAGMNLLKSNIHDEEIHDQALQNIVDALPELNVSSYEEEVKQFLSAFNDLEDHPICTARLIESSVFFVILPLLRFTGNLGIRTVAEDISRDETVHTAAHLHVSQGIGATYSKQADRLRREVVAWMTSDVSDFEASIGERHQNFADQGFLLKQSDMLLTTGKSDMVETRAQRVLAPFEINKVHMPRYY